ncbi:hypothetical protein FSP39_016930 [Pinctada imbricata]|uniref:Fork-head domain-containing protein n=1 Tax=Pinctada imbricata TaxID=66713 RepID=A0AA88Y4B5_PINIB|nr:hypothetical protein FSP39_016930 [Pinctada imbricata]
MIPSSFSIDFLTRDHDRKDESGSEGSPIRTPSPDQSPSPGPSESGSSTNGENTEAIAEVLLSLDKTIKNGMMLADSSAEKPPHSYIALISMAILSKPDRKILLCDIYQYIMDNFPYYNNKEKAWRNSIRHNLSLNECFVKNGRADNGKGNYWSIHPACVEDFARGDFRRRQARRRARKSMKDINQGSLSHEPCHDPSVNKHFFAGYVPMTPSPVGYHPYSHHQMYYPSASYNNSQVQSTNSSYASNSFYQTAHAHLQQQQTSVAPVSSTSSFPYSFQSCFCDDDDPKRSLLTSFLPGCGTVDCVHDGNSTGCGSGVAIVTARGNVDTLHYIISAVRGPPSIVVIRTNTLPPGPPTVGVNCEKLADEKTCHNGTIVLEREVRVLSTYSFVFTRLFQYNDTQDKADPDNYNVNSTQWRVYDFTDFIWEDMEAYSSNNLITLRVKNSKQIDGASISNGALEFQLAFSDHEERADKLPHLVNNEDSVQVDFTLRGIDAYSSARWVLEAAMMTEGHGGLMTVDQTRSIDDEYTPGVFTINNWLGNPSDHATGVYLQWKPVCYIDTPRSRSTATKVNHKSLTDTALVEKYINSSMVHCVEWKMSGKVSNFTFGLEKDDGFTKNFTSWFGSPPTDKVSTLVIGVISAGLGIPVVLIIFGGICVFIKRKTSKDYKELKDVTSDSSQIQ